MKYCLFLVLGLWFGVMGCAIDQRPSRLESRVMGGTPGWVREKIMVERISGYDLGSMSFGLGNQSFQLKSKMLLIEKQRGVHAPYVRVDGVILIGGIGGMERITITRRGRDRYRQTGRPIMGPPLAPLPSWAIFPRHGFADHVEN